MGISKQDTQPVFVATPAEAAEILRVSIDTVRRGIKAGTIPASRPGGRKLLIPMAWLETMVRFEPEPEAAVPA